MGSDPPTALPERSPAHPREADARALLERALRNLVPPSPPGNRTPVEESVDRARAACRLAQTAAAIAADFAMAARGYGVPWADLAGPLGLNRQAAERGVEPGDAAFQWCVTGQVYTHGRPGDPRDLVTDVMWAMWRCSTCDGDIVDHGPARHPADAEQGHSQACARHRAALAERHPINEED